ncbi:SusC/RagA family TonB-linked outer membrane protein [Sphingobacterium pedocola]|uniref:SusC/RagA family TonB-linked outer membrane protein n=1 Tax=Sphingobacterium pedocola TaxID=2082722 RepID=A0ABR9T8A7_9SPHI|nr:SusC/RagA family TonB-linked outer membrane protein [Sphingobacterium pedocola]MBE8721565.1 SusC/RagA family TonB-linked outer membrane protein [Sphingobacterium pedocola]
MKNFYKGGRGLCYLKRLSHLFKSKNNRSCTLFGFVLSLICVLFSDAQAQSGRTLGGVVRSTADGQPIANASVSSDKQQARTDTEGKFAILVNKPNGTIIIKHIGFTEQSVAYDEKTTSINIQLAPVDNILDEAVVIGYGTTTRRLNTGSVGKISGADITNQPVSNPLSALSGRIPGVVVSQTSGVPGSRVNIEIQGRNNLNPNQSADPLFIIDGVPFAANNDATNMLGNTLLSPFALINPADIESIEVLKDADATAIYGSRGAYGVVLITTKKGSSGKTVVKAGLHRGINRVTRLVDLLNTEQYLEMRREAFANDGVTPTVSNAPDLVLWDQHAQTDWQKELIGSSASSTDAQLSLSGGSKYTQFMVNGAYQQDNMVFRYSKPYTRTSARLNLNHRSENERLQIGMTAGYGTNSTKNTVSDLTNLTIVLPPNYPKTRDQEDDLIWEYDGVPLYYGNPYAYTKEKFESRSNALMTNMNLSYRLWKSLVAKVSAGYNTTTTFTEYMAPKLAKDPQYDVDGSMTTGDNTYHNWIVEPQLEYNDVLFGGKFQVLLGTTFQQTVNDRVRISATGFTADELMGSLGAATTYNLSSNTSDYRYSAIFGRINYNIMDRYILNLSGRRDGSSRFSAGRKFGNFGAVGAVWIFSEEGSIKDILPFLSFGKLRTSYGITGSDNIGDYQYMETWTHANTPYLNVKALYPSGLANANFRWEANRKLSLSVDLGFLKDRLLFNTTYFDNRSSNQLISTPLPRITGFTTIIENFPATVQNTGWELVVQSTNLKGGDLNWSTNINMTIPRNKLLDFPDLDRSNFANTYIVGRSLNLIRGYVAEGVNPESGLFTYTDLNDDGVLNIQDRIYLGNLDPKFYGGLQNSFTYKGFGIDIFMEYRRQMGRNYMNSLYSDVRVPGFIGNVPTYVMERWQQPGDQTDIQKFSANFGTPATAAGLQFANGHNTSVFSDASFIRLKTLAVNYTLPEKWVSKWGIDRLQVFGRAQNLFTWTSYKGSDPEVQNLRVLPPLRTYVFGIEINL